MCNRVACLLLTLYHPIVTTVHCGSGCHITISALILRLLLSPEHQGLLGERGGRREGGRGVLSVH